MDYDVFISYAHEDKDTIDQLVPLLQKEGLQVWLDTLEIILGDDIAEEINKGLLKSRYGVVILSKTFLEKKKWTKKELNSLLNRQATSGKKVILPVLHGLSPEELGTYSSLLAGIRAARTSDGMEFVAKQIVEVCGETESEEVISVFKDSSGHVGTREQCLEIIRQNDIVSWRKLINEKTQNIPEQLKAWKKVGESAAQKGGKEWISAVIAAAEICIPGFVPIFTAIEAGNKVFWKESIGILRRLAILEDEMGAGVTRALHIGNHMLYIAGTIGLAIAANLKLLDLIDEWMQIKIPQRQKGEVPWLQIRSAHYSPEGVGFNLKEPFDVLKTVCNSKELKNFFPNPEVFVDNILIANLLCSLIELRVCSQNQKCLDALMGKSEYFSRVVLTVWCFLPADKFRIVTLNLFGDSQGVISFVYPSGFMTLDKFWPLWKMWKEKCLNFWWQSSSGQYDLIMKKPWMLLPGEQAN